MGRCPAMNDLSLHDALDTSWLFFQTAFSTHRHPLRRQPFYTCRRLEVGRQRSRIRLRVLTCLHICFSVSIPVSASWNIRERNISWARETVCSSTAGFLTHIVQIKICSLCRWRTLESDSSKVSNNVE